MLRVRCDADTRNKRLSRIYELINDLNHELVCWYACEGISDPGQVDFVGSANLLELYSERGTVRLPERGAGRRRVR